MERQASTARGVEVVSDIAGVLPSLATRPKGGRSADGKIEESAPSLCGPVVISVLAGADVLACKPTES